MGGILLVELFLFWGRKTNNFPSIIIQIMSYIFISYAIISKLEVSSLQSRYYEIIQVFNFLKGFIVISTICSTIRIYYQKNRINFHRRSKSVYLMAFLYFFANIVFLAMYLSTIVLYTSE